MISSPDRGTAGCTKATKLKRLTGVSAQAHPLAKVCSVLLLVLLSLAVTAGAIFAQGGPSTPLTPTLTLNPTPTPTLEERYGATVLERVIAPVVVLILGGILGAAGTYFIKPRIEDLYMRRKVGKEAARRTESTRSHATDYLETLSAKVREVQNVAMDRPRDLDLVYIQLRVRERTRSYPRPEEKIELSCTERDPEDWLCLYRETLERRSQSAVVPEDALRQHQHLVILGDPGAGKTTMLNRLTLLSARGELIGLPAFPVLVSLHDFAESGFGDLLDFIADDCRRQYGFPDVRPYLDDKLKAGEVLLFLDGLDEVAEEKYHSVLERISWLVTRYRQVPVVVTSRLDDWRGGLIAGFHIMEVLDLRIEEIREFIEKWYGSDDETATGLQRELTRNTRMAALAANPLLLSLIAIVYQENLELPERRTQLYARCVDVLLTKRQDTSQPVRRVKGFDTALQCDLLREIAWHFHQQGRRYFRREELLNITANFSPKVLLSAEANWRILSEITTQHGLLKEHARGWYGFLHLALQDYFAACAAYEQGALDLVLSNMHRPWWKEVTLLLAGMGDVTLLLKGILTRPEDIFHSNLCLAGRCLVGRPLVSESALYTEIPGKLRACLRKAELPTEAELLATVLAELGDVESNDLLLSLLADEEVNWLVRERIAEALGLLGERSLAPRLVETLADGEVNRYVQCSIAIAVGELGERRVAPRLVELLANERIHSSVRECIVEALGTLGDRTVVPRLVELVASEDVDLCVRERIAGVLGAVGEWSVSSQLAGLLTDEQVSLAVRERLAAALGELGDQSVASQLVTLLTNESVDWSVREEAARSLGVLGDRSVAPHLMKLLEDGRVALPVQRGIAAALELLGDQGIIPRLLDLLADVSIDWHVRLHIANTLRTLGKQRDGLRAVERLATEQTSPAERASIAAARGMLGDRSVAPRLVRFLVGEEIDRYTQRSIIQTLRTLGESSVAPDLLELLANGVVSSSLWSEIVETLAMLGNRRVASRMVDLLTEEGLDAPLRGDIASVLGMLGERNDASRLAELLADESLDWYVRLQIAEALRVLGDNKEVVCSLVALLDHTNEFALREAIYAALYHVSQRAGARVLQDGSILSIEDGLTP